MSNLSDTLFWRNLARRQQAVQQEAEGSANNLIHSQNFVNSMYGIQQNRNKTAEQQGAQSFAQGLKGPAEYDQPQESEAAQMGYNAAQQQAKAASEAKLQRATEMDEKNRQATNLEHMRQEGENSRAMLRYQAETEANAINRARFSLEHRQGQQKLKDDAAFQVIFDDMKKNDAATSALQHQLSTLAGAPPGTDIEWRRHQIEKQLIDLQTEKQGLDETRGYIAMGMRPADAYQYHQQKVAQRRNDAQWLYAGKQLGKAFDIPAEPQAQQSTQFSVPSGIAARTPAIGDIPLAPPALGTMDMPAPPMPPSFNDPSVHASPYNQPGAVPFSDSTGQYTRLVQEAYRRNGR